MTTTINCVCGYEWVSRIDKPKACPECKRRLRSFLVPIVPAGTSGASAPQKGKYLLSVQWDMERDIPKLTRTPKDQFDDACATIRSTYENQDAAEEVIAKAKENKLEYAKQQNQTNS